MDFSLKYYRVTPLIISILCLAAFIDWSIANWIIPCFKYLFVNEAAVGTGFYLLRAPSNAAIIGSILWAYNQWAWKCPVAKLLVKVPD